ncbi:hypothetical protein ACAG25_22985 [Mycobacterium sp. pV006]|uniref:hypothetical protein n=1 Tax=Mycobacterium sp. pV006 TaxID=3238983 RepID=UPI00351BB330
MQDDLLRFVGGPPGYSPWWLVLGVLLLALVICWYATVFVATMPSQRLRRIPVIRDLHARVLRHRYERTVASIGRRHRAGELSDAQAGAELSSALRSFLHQATGQRAQYMHVRAIAMSENRTAAPLLDTLESARFDRTAEVDVARLADETGELIRSWR